MFEQISTFFTIEMIYLWANIGVIPVWFILIFFPNSNICKFFALSIFPILVFSCLYVFLIYYFFVNNYEFINNFKLYLGLETLKSLFSEESFLMLFWIHFLALNLFCGAYIVKDSRKFMISKYLTFLPLTTTYFVGPLGILIYWFIRIFFAKNINLIE